METGSGREAELNVIEAVDGETRRHGVERRAETDPLTNETRTQRRRRAVRLRWNPSHAKRRGKEEGGSGTQCLASLFVQPFGWGWAAERLG